MASHSNSKLVKLNLIVTIILFCNVTGSKTGAIKHTRLDNDAYL